MFDEKPDAEIDAVKQSQTGKRLTEGQLSDAMNLTGVIRQHIHKTGSFIEPLTDYAHAFARNEKFDAARGEMILRDVYSARHGESMNQTREALLEVEQALERGSEQGLNYALSIEVMIKDGDTMPFYKAHDRAAVDMARDLRITESGAKRLMKEGFAASEGKELYTWGKEIEETYHRPVAEAERAASREKSCDNRRSYARRGPAR